MLDKVLLFIANHLNKNLKLTYGLTEDMAIPGSLINLDGSVTNTIENKIILSIINLEQEKVVKHSGEFISSTGGKYGRVNPPIFLNLYLLISANYNAENYLEALKMLSAIIKFFQSSAVFTSSAYPDLDSSIERLTFEVYNIPVRELSHIWSGIGAKYVPSIVYKVRMIGVQGGQIKEEITGIGGLHNNTQKR